jgi:HEAT repeat protein
MTVNATATREHIGKTVAAASTYDYGKSRMALRAVEKLIRETHGDAEMRGAIEEELGKLLASGASLAVKQFVCKKLWEIGSDASVPALAALLSHEQTVEMACYALLNLRSESADRALRSALDRVRGTALVAVINCIAERRDARSVPALAKLAGSGDELVADAAVAALGKIAADGSVEALGFVYRNSDEPRRVAALHALLHCAQELARKGEQQEATAIYEKLSAQDTPRHVRRGARLGLRGRR